MILEAHELERWRRAYAALSPDPAGRPGVPAGFQGLPLISPTAMMEFEQGAPHIPKESYLASPTRSRGDLHNL